MTTSVSIHDLPVERVEPAHFVAMLAHASASVRAARWDAERQLVTVDFGGSDAQWASLLERVRAQLAAPAGKRPRIAYAHASDRALPRRHIWNALVRAGMVIDFGEGHIAYRGLFRELVERLDAALQAIAAERHAEAVDLPDMLPLAAVHTAGAFEQHAHDLFFAAPLVSDLDCIDAFRRDAATSGRPPSNDALAPPRYCLKTSACAPLYPALAHTEFAAPAQFTMLGRCTRHEANTAISCERLTEFRMREIVFVGGEDGAAEFERFSLQVFRDLIECFDLRADIRTASDSFFLASYSQYRFMQLAGSEKYEARIFIPDTHADIAVGSFNHHRRFFGRRFGLTYRGAPAVTACIGFGLERLAYGILCQSGIDRTTVLATLDRLGDRRAHTRAPR